jgi:arginyl-tRNA synthetase
MNIEEILSRAIQEAFKSIYELDIETVSFQETNKEFEGSHTFVVFSYTKKLGKSPEQIGQSIGAYLLDHTNILSSFNVVKGFLNLSIKDSIWLELLKEAFQNPDFGQLPARNQKVMVEFSSPNTNKPLHLGHLRNIFLGDSVANILQASGYDVVRTNLANDRGIHICKSMVAYMKHGNGETPESTGLKGDALVGKYYVMFSKLHESQITDREVKNPSSPILEKAQELLKKWEEGDEETVNLWKKMNDWVYAGFAETYASIGIKFDKRYQESETYLLGKDIIEEGLEKEVFYKRENGSVWIDLTDIGLDHKLLLRADGTSVYITQDMGTADLKYQDYQMSKSIYVVGNEQDYHFKVLFEIMKKLGRPYSEGMYHLSYGMVDLPTGKMKTREGTVVDADMIVTEMQDIAKQRTLEKGFLKIDDFSEEELQKLYHTIGIGALKYFLIKVDPKKRILFNPNESIDFQGDASPFVQYNYARTAAIVRKAKELKLDLSWNFNLQDLQEAEKSLIILLNKYPGIIQEAATGYSPSFVVQYVYELAKAYSHFFDKCSIFKAETEGLMRFRVILSIFCGSVLKKALELLGIEVAERM